MSNENTKVSANKQKKIAIVTQLSEKFGKAKAVVFTNYQGLTHKQLEGFKKAIKPLRAEYVVAKNSLLTRALEGNKIKLSEDQTLDGQTGTLFLYDDVMSPLKALAKIIKELNLPSVKFGIMENDFITGEQVLKLSALPTKEVLLAQLVAGLKSPILGLHRALTWNLQKFVLALNSIAQAKPALAVVPAASEPIVEPIAKAAPEQTAKTETAEAKTEEQPKEETKTEEVKNEGGEN